MRLCPASILGALTGAIIKKPWRGAIRVQPGQAGSSAEEAAAQFIRLHSASKRAAGGREAGGSRLFPGRGLQVIDPVTSRRFIFKMISLRSFLEPSQVDARETGVPITCLFAEHLEMVGGVY
ncbi:hypothetical protein NDU88_001139 [Pleurodeles waltl]|uniref:Uncharacterized protein n=1 Tax=Pleurodeles waltl TaxID=8319 RepID=A0AAV7MJQ4_PLEWA|nr:hypothetical protein NDU88_001139 [Pleurodeles waltl]